MAVLCRVTYVVRGRALKRGKTPSQDLNDLCGIVARKRRLRDVSDFTWIRHLGVLRVLDALNELNPVGQLPECSLDLGVADVPDQQYLVTETVQPQHLPVNLGNQRAGGVDRPERATLGCRLDGLGNAMSGEDCRRALWYFIHIFDEYGSL